MRRYKGYGPFLPPDDSNGEAILEEADEALKEKNVGATSMNSCEKFENPVETEAKNSHQEFAEAMDDLVKMLSSGEIEAANEGKLGKLRKDLEEGVLDPDDLLFDLLRVYEDELELLEEEGIDLNDVEMEAAGGSSVKRVVQPPGSETSGYSSASSVGSLSPHGPSIKEIKTEKSLEDLEMGVSLDTIKEEAEEDRDNVQGKDGHDKNDSFSVGKIKGEEGGQSSGQEMKTFEFNAAIQEDYDTYILLKHYYAQYGTGEWEGGVNEPGPEVNFFEMVCAVAQLEEEMQLPDNERTVQVERIAEVEEGQDGEDEEIEAGEEDLGLDDVV